MKLEDIALIGAGIAGVGAVFGYSLCMLNQTISNLGIPNRTRRELVRQGISDESLPQAPSYGRQFRELLKLDRDINPLWSTSYEGSSLEERYRNMISALS